MPPTFLAQRKKITAYADKYFVDIQGVPKWVDNIEGAYAGRQG